MQMNRAHLYATSDDLLVLVGAEYLEDLEGSCLFLDLSLWDILFGFDLEPFSQFVNYVKSLNQF